MSAFFDRSEPVTVTTFAFTEDGEIVGNIYYVIKLRNENKFLASNYRVLPKKNWTAKLTRAILWGTIEHALTFAKEHFTNVTEEI